MREPHINMNFQRQRGVALIMSLVFLVLLTIIGVTAMNTTVLEERMAGNMRDQHFAFHAAEAGLINGENWIGSAIVKPIFDSSVTNDGLHDQNMVSPPIWEQSSTWSGTDIFAYSGLTEVASQPKYIIEDLGEIADKGGSLTLPSNYKTKGKNLFRITSRGTGSTDFSQAMVQSTYEKRF